ncbi:hypothetical protein TWF730_002669 [Orbilia blumenaviensis]|uniref:Uncharacterized protein n=1 Tax=Orbilia blumenaviensis TaxID=1796055 RepID=A0AAV9UB65_9PEZI
MFLKHLPTIFSIIIVAAITVATVHITYVVTERRQFRVWYPEFGFIFDSIVQNNCTEEYGLYTTGVLNRTEWEQSSRWLGGGSTSALVVPLLNCILDNTPEYLKSGMSSASVVLGLTPGILAAFGSDVPELATLSVIGRRRFLALSLSLGSPAVNPLRLFEYRGFSEILGDRQGRLKPRFFNLYIESLILVIEFVIVFGAIVNNIILGYELGIKTVASFAPHHTFLPLLWILLAAVPHIAARMGLSCLVVVKSVKRRMVFRNHIQKWFAPWMEPEAATLQISDETPLYLFMSSFVSILTCGHFIFGTLLFSSVLFVSVRDSIPILARFLLSVFACRLVLVYELARLRQLYNATDGYRLAKPGEGQLQPEEKPIFWESVEDLSGHGPAGTNGA